MGSIESVIICLKNMEVMDLVYWLIILARK